MRLTKKFISMLLTITMITTMMPAMAFAAQGGLTEITSVEITDLPIPVAGEKPDFSATIPEGAPYHLASVNELHEVGYIDLRNNYNGIWWINDNTSMGQDELFEKGKRYRAEMVLVPDDGYVFAEEVTAIINGESCYINSHGVSVYARSNSMEAIENAIQVADYSKVNEAIRKIPEKLEIYTDETLKILIDSKNAVKLGLDVTKQAEVDKMASDIEKAIKGLVLKTEIKSVEITDLEIPVAGEKPDFSATIPEGVPYHFASREEIESAEYYNADENYNGIWWINKDGNMVPDKIFEAGKIYGAQIVLIPNDGYMFAEEVSGTINGESCYTSSRIKAVVVESNVVEALEPEIGDVTLNKYFTKVNNDTYKYRANGKQVIAKPIVKNVEGTLLKEGVDYTVIYSNKNRVLPGKYTITVKGIGKYTNTVKKTLIITPNAVSKVNVRLGAYNNNGGGYDDAYVTWNKSAGADGYYVYMRRPNIKDNGWKLAGTVTGTSLLKKNLYDGYKYEFKVLPYVKADINYKTTGNYKVAEVQTLMKTKINSAKKYNNERTRLTWTNIKGETGYQVMVSAKGKTRYFTINSAAANAKVVKNAKTTFKVRAYKDVKNNSGKTIRVYAPWSDARIFTLR